VNNHNQGTGIFTSTSLGTGADFPTIDGTIYAQPKLQNGSSLITYIGKNMIESRQEWLEKISERYGLNEEDIIEIIVLFFESFDEDLTEIKQAYDTGGMDEFIRLTHGIKGAAASIGLDEVADIARDLESQGRDNEVSNFSANIDNLIDEVNDCRQLLGIS
jgi:HPt (histidine-containing phosphotransfer) domain-containing protein